MKNKILAIVNGKEITENDIQQSISRFPEDRRQYLSTEQGKKQLLEQIISFELIYNEAKDNGLENDAEYKDQIEAMKRELLTQLAIKRILDEAKVSEDDAEKYYEANKAVFKEAGKVNAKHILVDTEDKALKIKKEIQEGKSFEDAAREYSTCPSKAQGGDLGSFTRGQMVPEFEDVAFSQEVGIVGDPVKTQFGYHIIKVESRKEEEPKAYEEVKEAIINRLTQERQNMKYTEHTENLKKKYSVDIK
ncbi:peptidyl-prolyl cis-trans isomerase C [Clostridium acidisoli DSM 12555]|uniref:Peptidyl-prolyl cis-trans isomerase C n=1 Tax=Clostridium acidisoli DSM 12555 TaxID=1121291 RepID=A0A1W1Y0K4_9CLOT|nr:peptidylprolyl isomerase [Clostridium acidisoli]SMC29321.1 peptidyl-prolyl cis-trans isomerase C [Clostridium acidisoli DSM 12555]